MPNNKVKIILRLVKQYNRQLLLARSFHNVEGQSPVKNAGLLLLLLFILLFLLHLLHSVVIGLVPGALRLARVQLGAKPRERREDGVTAARTAGETEVCLDARVAGFWSARPLCAPAPSPSLSIAQPKQLNSFKSGVIPSMPSR